MIKRALINRLGITYFVLFSVNSLSSALVLAFSNGPQWAQMTPTAKFIIVTLVVQNWTGTMLAFINKSANRISEGKTFIPSDDTTVITKTEITK